MKLTRSEFCQFSLHTRFELLREFGENILKQKIRRKLLSVYRIFDFYVEVYEVLPGRRLEKVEPIINLGILDVYHKLRS